MPSIENALDFVQDETPKGVAKPEDSPLNEYPRWWSQIEIGRANVGALLDTGCPHTAMGPVALLIAPACGIKVQPYTGPGAKVATQDIIPILGHIELPFEIAGIRRF